MQENESPEACPRFREPSPSVQPHRQGSFFRGARKIRRAGTSNTPTLGEAEFTSANYSTKILPHSLSLMDA